MIEELGLYKWLKEAAGEWSEYKEKWEDEHAFRHRIQLLPAIVP